MAWGPDANTEDELEKLAAVRTYLAERFPGTTIHSAYDAPTLSQIFRVDTVEAGDWRTVIVATEFLDQHQPEQVLNALTELQVAEHVRSARAGTVRVNSWGIEEP